MIHLLLAANRPTEALQVFASLTETLDSALGQEPEEATLALIHSIQARHDRLGDGVSAAARNVTTLPGKAAPTPRSSPSSRSAHPSRFALPSPALPPGITPSPYRQAHFLPLPLTRLFGRDEAIRQLDALLLTRARRLITLTGSAGVGKTRMALAVAEGRRRAGGNVFFIGLADCPDAALLPDFIRAALPGGITGTDVADAILQTLRAGEDPLLILDNFEHLAAGGAPFLEALLAQAPHLSCLVTSRQRLPIDGENEFRVHPLPVPDTLRPIPYGAKPDLSALLRTWPSLALFVDRAQLAQPDFQITAQNTHALIELVQRLEGVPLALELAAARVPVCPLPLMLKQFPEQLDLLVHPRRPEPDRHRSLRETLRWSVSLLTPELRAVFLRLSVFRGGFTGDDAAAVTGRGAAVINDLQRLCDASLIQAHRPATEADTLIETVGFRFTFLETVRAFGGECLTGHERSAARMLHVTQMLLLAETAETHLQGKDQKHWLHRLEVEKVNLGAALEWLVSPCARSEMGLMGLRIACAIAPFWMVRGHLTEGRRWLESVLEPFRASSTTDATDATDFVMRGLNAAGILAMRQGDLQAAMALYQECLERRREAGDPRGIATQLNNLAIVAAEQDRPDEARRLYEESLILWRTVDDQRCIGMVLTNLAVDSSRRGWLAEAETLLEESLRIAREFGDARAEATRLHNLGDVRHRQGDRQGAWQLHRESLSRRRALEDVQGCAYSILNLARLCGESGDWETGVRWLSASVAELQRRNVTVSAFWEADLTPARASARAVLGEGHFAAATHDGEFLLWETLLDEVAAAPDILQPGDTSPSFRERIPSPRKC